MAATIEDVRCFDVTGEFKDVGDPLITRLLTRAAACIDEDVWLSLNDDVEALYVLHWISELSKGSAGPAGPVTGHSAGGLSQTYAAPTFDDNSLSSSAYGRQIIDLRGKIALNRNTVIYTDPAC